MDPITIDCASCPVRGTHCDGCMVTALVQLPASSEHRGRHDLPPDAEDRACIDRFVASGLLSPGGARRVRVTSDRPGWEATG